MSETNQGPLDPAFAKFRDQKIVEKLTEKVNAPMAAVAAKPVEKVADAPPPKAAPITDRKAPLAQVDPEFDKFLEKARNEAEAEEVAKDDARLFFGAGPPRKAEDGPPPIHDEDEGPRPADAPPKVGESLKLIDIATGDAPPAPISRAKPAAAPPPKPVAAPAPKPVAAFAPKPLAASPPKPAAPAPKPAAPAPKPASAAPARPRPAAAPTEPAAEIPRVELPARPPASSGDSDLAAELAGVRQKLAALLGESSSRLLELKVASAEGIDRAITAFESEAKRLRECLERSEAVTDEAAKAADEASGQADLQDQLEDRVRALAERSQQLAERSTALREKTSDLEALGAKLDAQVTERQEGVERTRSEVDRLCERHLGLVRDLDDVKTIRDRLGESVERLEKLRDAHQAAIQRLKGMKDALTKPA